MGRRGRRFVATADVLPLSAYFLGTYLEAKNRIPVLIVGTAKTLCQGAQVTRPSLKSYGPFVALPGPMMEDGCARRAADVACPGDVFSGTNFAALHQLTNRNKENYP
jgi:hypothetical protein